MFIPFVWCGLWYAIFNIQREDNFVTLTLAIEREKVIIESYFNAFVTQLDFFW